MFKERLPFSHSIGVCSPDFEEACCFINAHIDDRNVSPLSAGGTGNNILTCQSLGGSLLFGGQWSERVHIQSEAQTTFHVIQVLEGAIYCKPAKSHAVRGELLVMPPKEQADLIWEQSTKAVVISLSRQALIDQFGLRVIEAPNQTTRIIASDQKDALLLQSHIECLARQHHLCAGEIEPAIQNQWEQLLLTQLTQLLTSSGPDDHPVVLPCHIRLAVDWVMAHLEDPISVGDLLNVTGTSRRSLETGFRTYLNTTPAKFILNRKLVGVRNALQSDSNLNIGDIAFSFGFNHLSHFTQQYKETFGELPSETIQRRRHERILFGKKARSRAT